MRLFIQVAFLVFMFSQKAASCDLEIEEGEGRKELQQKLNCLSLKIEANSSTPIATIIASHLTPTQMKEIYGNSWVLADGSNVSADSKYFEATKLDAVPDLRGVFLRGMNEGRSDGREDPESERQIGSFQDHMIASHNHPLPYQKHSLANGKGAGNLESGGSNTSTSNRGGPETRPRNVAVYFYIRVN